MNSRLKIIIGIPIIGTIILIIGLMLYDTLIILLNNMML